MAYGLYGSDGPAYKLSGTKYALAYATVLKDEPEWEVLVHASILNGHRTVVNKGAHWVIELEVGLHRDNNLDDAFDNATRLQNLLWNDSSVTYYRHSNGAELKDSSGTAVSFKLVEFEPLVADEGELKDAVFLKFISVDYVKIVPTQT